MSVIQIRKAQREGARLVIGLAGVSGSGKTRTAIELAYGLANFNPAKVGFLDTENRRGSLYADCLWNHPTHPTREAFLIGDLYPPFSPDRYIAAIEEFQRAGVEVLVIDSASHEWEGEGGAQEIAEAGNPKMPNWNLAKKLHKRFVNKLLQCDMHVVVCLRAREKAKPEKQVDPQTGREKSVFVDLGLQPITEKNFMFEMTASLMMHDQGTRQDVQKCPQDLVRILGRGQGYITAADGKALRDWVDGAKALDPKIEAFRNRLQSNAEQGLAHITECWAKTPADVQKALGEEFRATLFASAQGYDQQRELEAGAELTHANDNSPAIDALNAELQQAGGQGASPAPEASQAAAPAAPAPAAAEAPAPTGRRSRTLAPPAPAESAPAAAQAAPPATAAPAAATPATKPTTAPAGGPVDLF